MSSQFLTLVFEDLTCTYFPTFLNPICTYSDCNLNSKSILIIP